MALLLPPLDAVTYGELNGELIHITPCNDIRLSNEFKSKSKPALFLPARITLRNTRTSYMPGNNRNEDDSEKSFELQIRFRTLSKILGAAKILLWDTEDIALHCIRRWLNEASRFASSTISKTLEGVLPAALSNMIPIRDPLRETRAKKIDFQIICIDWHPTLALLAVAQADDVVSFYDVSRSEWDARKLIHHQQQKISKVVWARYAGGTIAVACRNGVFLWNYKQRLPKAEPHLDKILQHPTEIKYDDISWNMDGSMLVASSDFFGHIHVYDTITMRRTEINCIEYPQSLHWSPRGDYLFCITSEKRCVLWETCTWLHETWDVDAECATWSNDGTSLLLAINNERLIYHYIFRESAPMIDVTLSIPAIDFSEQETGICGAGISEIIGGVIIKMAWDPRGSRVAIIYQQANTTNCPANYGRSKTIAILSVVQGPPAIITKSGFIRGPMSSEWPTDICFSPHFKDGALLCVSWSSGLVSFHPFYL